MSLGKFKEITLDTFQLVRAKLYFNCDSNTLLALPPSAKKPTSFGQLCGANDDDKLIWNKSAGQQQRGWKLGRRRGELATEFWEFSATQNVKRKLCKINYNWKQMNAKTISSQRIPRKSQKASTATLPIKIKERPQGVAQGRWRERVRERGCTNQKLRALKQMFTPTKQAQQQQQQQKRGQQAAACPVFGELELWQN